MNDKERLQLENELLLNCSKAQAINKYIDELEENSKLSELWCKSQQENQLLKEKYLNAVADYEYEKCKNQKAIKYLEEHYSDFPDGMKENYDEETIKILKGE